MALPNPTPSNIRHLKPRRHITMIDDDVVETIALTMGPTALGVYTYLERKAGPDGKCHPSNDELSRFAHISLRQIQRICNDLESAGWIEQEVVIGRFKQTLGKVYTLPFHKKPDEYRGDIVGDMGGDMGGDIPGDMDDANMSPKVDTEYLQVSTESTPLTPQLETEPDADASEQVRTTNRPNYSPEFEAFWKAYPSGHGSKKPTWDQWKRLRPDPETQFAMLDGLDRWKACGRWQRGYIKGADSWIRNRMWEDEPPQDETRDQPTRSQFSNQPDIGYTNEQLDAMIRGEQP